MSPLDLLSRAEALGVSVKAEGNELVLRSRTSLPDELISDLRRNKAEVLAVLHSLNSDDLAAHPTACRGCARVIPAGTTLCVDCGSARSPLIKFAVQLSNLSDERTLRGQVLVALDRRHYPRVRMPTGDIVGPGLLEWCPILRDAKTSQLAALLELINTPQSAERRGEQK